MYIQFNELQLNGLSSLQEFSLSIFFFFLSITIRQEVQVLPHFAIPLISNLSLLKKKEKNIMLNSPEINIYLAIESNNFMTRFLNLVWLITIGLQPEMCFDMWSCPLIISLCFADISYKRYMLNMIEFTNLSWLKLINNFKFQTCWSNALSPDIQSFVN